MRTVLAFLALALVPAATYAAPTAPGPIVELTKTVLRAANSDNASAFSGLFTGDAVVVDENPPFVWRGAGAGVAWWHAVDAVIVKMKMIHMRAIGVRIGEFKQTGTDAYMVQSLTISGIAGGKPMTEPGTMTYTFHKSGGTWLISTMVWTTKP